MKTFSRLSLLTLACFMFAVMLVGSSVLNVYAQEVPEFSLTVDSTLDPAGTDYIVGASVTVKFTAIDKNSDAAQGAKITIDVMDLNEVTVNETDVSTFPHIATAGLLGVVTVTGKITEVQGTVQGIWKDDVGNEKAKNEAFTPAGMRKGNAPALIIVKLSDPKKNRKIGDNFKQTISIENRDDEFSTLPLSAWQMDIVFNPAILEVVDIQEGLFLKRNRDDTLFIAPTSRGRISASQALAGQTAGVATAPSPSGISLAPNGDNGTLLTIEFKVLAFAEESLGIHNVLLQSDEDEDEDGTLDRISYSILVQDVFVATEHQTYIYEKEDVNQDEMVDIMDLMIVASSIGTHNPRTDINGDGFVNVLDLVLIYTSPLWGESAPATLDQSFTRSVNLPSPLAPSTSRNVDPATIQSWIDQAQVEDDGSAIFDHGITNLETLLNSRVPTKTRLLLNYPNPFNPETWIPYQLAEATNVTLSIYSVNGTPIRTLSLGHQPAGTYISKSRAAYWDGQNEFGEKAASGLYFYTFTAGKFSATGKMLIRK